MVGVLREIIDFFLVILIDILLFLIEYFNSCVVYCFVNVVCLVIFIFYIKLNCFFLG